MRNRATLYICEAEPATVAGLRWFLAETQEFQVVGVSAAAPLALGAIRELRPDVVLTDHSTGMGSTLRFLSELERASVSTGCVLWLRDVAEAELVRAFRSGAKGFVRKASPLPVVLEALRRVAQGERFLEDSASTMLRQMVVRGNVPRLTPRERDIVGLVAEGMKNREIAEQLHITQGTVKVHLMHVFEKTGARDRYELALRGPRLLMEIEPLEEARKLA